MELLYTLRFAESEEERGYLMHFAHLAIVLLIWYIINWAIRHSTKTWYENAIFRELNRTSYGIYVLHYWIQTMLLSSSVMQLLNIETLATKHVYIFPFLFFLLSLTASYIGTKMLLKTRVGRFLIG